MQIIVSFRAAYAIEEFMDHVGSARGALDLGMELHTVKAVSLVFNRRIRAVVGAGDRTKSLRQLDYLIGMAHKSDLRRVQTLEQIRAGIYTHCRLTILADEAGRNGAAA